MFNIKEDLTGLKQGDIEIIRRVMKPKRLSLNGSYWEYRCSCGEIKIAHRTTVIRGLKSCGCSRKKKWFKTKSTVHYRYLYNVWKALHYRCYNLNNKHYFDYGGRCIKVYKRWHKFENFYNDMIDTYQRGLTIERKDVDGDYCKRNCIWITNQEQADNRRSSLRYREKTGYVWKYAKK